jgi:lipopolysaccharide heptosyltransferase III
VRGTVLVFRVGQLGDTLVALPAIDAIRRRHPDHRLVLLTDEQPPELKRVSSWEVLGPTGWFDAVLPYRPARGWRQALTALRLLARLRRLKPDVVYDLAPERSPRQIRRDRFFMRLVGATRYHGGAPRLERGRPPDGRLPRLEPEWKRLLGIVGGPPEPAPFRLAVPGEARRRVRQRFADLGIPEDAAVLAIAPGSTMPAKRWPVERFREVGQRLLSENAGLHVLVLGGEEDAPLGDALCGEWGERAHNLAGALSVYESAAALTRGRGYLGNDTGAMHLAAMVGVPCVALFSARDHPGVWEPYGEGHTVLRHETDCAGCRLEVCTERGNECLRLIGVEEALRAARRLLQPPLTAGRIATSAPS